MHRETHSIGVPSDPFTEQIESDFEMILNLKRRRGLEIDWCTGTRESLMTASYSKVYRVSDESKEDMDHSFVFMR